MITTRLPKQGLIDENINRRANIEGQLSLGSTLTARQRTTGNS